MAANPVFIHFVTRPAISPLFVTHEAGFGFTPEYRAFVNLDPIRFFVRWQDGIFSVFFEESDFRAVGRQTLEKAQDDPAFIKQYQNRIETTCEALLSASRKIADANLAELNDTQLAALWEKRMDAHRSMMAYGFLAAIPQEAESQAMRILSEKVPKSKDAKIPEYFTALTQPEAPSYARLCEIDLLEKAASLDAQTGAKIRGGADAAKMPEIAEWLSGQTGKWGWQPYEYDGNDYWKESHFAAELSAAVGNEPRKRLDALRQQPAENKKRKKEVLAELGLSRKEQAAFELIAALIYSKEYRNGLRCKANWLSEKLLRDACRRTGASLSQIRYLFPQEMAAFLAGKITPDHLSARRAFSCYYSDDGKSIKSAVGQEARTIADALLPKNAAGKTGELSGQCASPGFAKGTVRVVLDAKDSGKVKNGDVLVTRMTTPDFVPAMKRACAIVTDDGGITCHAAIISRELGVPCLIGTQFATSTLKDGDVVQVDADKGRVRKIPPK